MRAWIPCLALAAGCASPAIDPGSYSIEDRASPAIAAPARFAAVPAPSSPRWMAPEPAAPRELAELTALDDPRAVKTKYDWTALVSVYYWAMRMDGDVTVQGVNGSLSSSPFDFANAGDATPMVHAEVWAKAWGVFFDAFAVDAVGQDATSNGAPASIEESYEVARVGGFYRYWDYEDAIGLKTFFDLVAGARLFSVGQDLETGTTSVSASRDWVDPIVGARVITDLGDRWFMTMYGDVGGFGLLNGSRLTWNFEASFGWNFTRHMFAYFGYRWLGADYSDGTGADEYLFNVQSWGPILGMGVGF